MPFVLMILLSAFVVSAKTYESEGQKFTVEDIVSRKEVIWGFDFLPDGKIVFTERSGKMFLHDPATKTTTHLTGTPKVYAEGQGGLLDVRVDPKFKENSRIFFTYAEPVGKKESTTAVGSAELKDGKLTQVKKIFSAQQAVNEDVHYGSRIEFDPEGNLFVTIGERGVRKPALQLNHHLGKIVRIKPDGSAAEGNPFAKTEGAKPEIWSMGHRSPQGMMRDPATGLLWMTEMGPRGGDELNLIKPGQNYGWPEVTKGREYWGPKIGTDKKDGVVEPVAFWVPSISPSGMSFYTGDKFPKWKGNIFVGNLSGEHLRRLVLDGEKVIKQEELLSDLDYRFRCVRQSADGYLYFSTDEGKIGRLKNL